MLKSQQQVQLSVPAKAEDMAPAASRRLLHVVKDGLQSCADMVQGAVDHQTIALDHGKRTRKRVSGLPAALKVDQD